MIKEKKSSNKGITIISLVLTIVILTILSTISIFAIRTSNNVSPYNNMVADINLLEDKILIYYNKYNEIPKTSEEIEIEGIKYYKIDLSKLENITLNFGVNEDSEDYYLVNNNLEVYYKKGIEKDGEIYHSVSNNKNYNPDIEDDTQDEESKLPKGYVEVEYLESTGIQFFNLEIIPKKNFGAYQKCSKASATTNEALFGCRETSWNTRFLGFTAYRGDLSCGYSQYYYFNKNTLEIGTSNEETNIPYTPNTVFEAWTNYKNDRKIKAKSIDESFDFTSVAEIGSASFSDLITFTKPIYVFGYMNYDNNPVGCSCKIYDLEITDGEQIISELIPCLDNNKVPCMYDAIRNLTFYNEGTGDFIAGPEV